MKAKLNKLFTLLTILTLGITNVWANQTELISGKTLPDIPSASLNVATQSTFTADANGWIVFDPYAEVANLSTVPSWWGHTAKATQGQAFASADLETLSPTAPFVAKSTNHFRINTGNAAAIRFTGAEAISVLVHPRSSSSGKEICATLFSYDSGATPAQVKVGDEKKTSSQTFHEFLFNGLTTSSTYVLYVYNNGTSQNGCLAEVAIKKHVNVTGPFAISYDKNDEGASGTMTDASSPYTKDATVTVLANSFTAPTGKVFVEWNTKANGSGTSYNAGDTFSAAEDVVLYAQWAYPATGTGTITYTLTKGKADVSAEVSGVSTLSSSSTAFSVSTLAIGSNNAKDGYSGQITGHAADYSASQYVALQFTVADGYTFTPSAVSMKVFANSTSNMKMKLVFTDGVTSVESEELACASSADSDIEFASGAFTGKKFVGNVDVVLYQWGVASKRTYVKSPVTITGTVAAAVPVTNYTVTINPNGGSYASTPDGWTESAGVYTKSIASGTSFTAPEGLTKGTDDLTWKDGSANDVTFPVSITGDITFVAQWAPHAASSNANLSALSVAGCTLNETFDPATTAYTITLPFYGAMPAAGDVTATKDDANAADPVVSISGNVITIACEAEDNTPKTYTITVSFASTPMASSSINIEQLVLDNGRNWSVVAAALATANVITAEPAGLDSLNDSKAARNYGFLGLKFKKATSKVTVIVPASSVLNVKWGNIATAIKVNVNGVAQSDIATKTDGTSTIYHLDAESYVREVVFYLTVADKTVTLQQVKVGADVDPITLPWLVTYDAGAHGTCATAEETWKGSALTLPVVTPESGWNFEGWKDDEDNPVTSPYTPTKNVTLTAQYTAQASPFDLTALTYQIGSAAAENVGYVDGTFTYNIELPYAPSYDAITVAPTLKEASSSLKGDEVLVVTSLPGAATFTVVENGGADERLYTVNFTKAQKDGLSIIKAIADATSQDIKAENLSGLYKKAGHIYTSGSYKLDQKRYFMVQLEDGKNFQEGDVVEINVSSVNDCNGFTIYSNISGDDFADGDLIVDTHDETGAAAKVSAGINKITLPSYAGSNKLYVARKNGTEKYLNAGINQVEVKRAMNPVLTAIQFNSTDVEVTSTTVAVLLPQGTNLGTMTVTPTIYWNGAGSAAPTAAWAWGANTYRVTDKDGDYTDYTITLTEDELKHNVSFNTHGGSTIDPVQVVDGQKLTAAPADPTKDDYLFQGWAETEDGSIVDVTSFTITADKEFHAVWAADGAIKLIVDGSTPGEKVINHTDFYTGATMADSPVEIESVNYDYATLANNATTPVGVNALNKFIAYNATTTQTKVMVNVYNSSTSARQVLIKGVVEGSTDVVDLATIDLDNGANKHVQTAYYTFDNAANRTIYISTASSASSIYFVQVKVIESGTPLKMFGESGYSINLNKGRLFGPSSTDLKFEGMTYNLGSNYNALNSNVAVFKKLTSYQVDIPAAVTMTVTTANAATYYVSAAADGTDNETSFEGATEFNLTAGTWYINVGGSNLNVTNIAFSAPKAAKPVVTDLANVDYCSGETIDALTVSATVSDGGTMTYQWYKDDAIIAGAEAATYQPTADGEYYVIVVNTKSGYENSDPTQSNTIAVTGHAGTTISGTTSAEDWPDANVTISVTASGKNLHYAWYTCEDALGTNPVAVDPAVDAATLNVTVGAADSYYKVVVSGDCGSAQEAIITVVTRMGVPTLVDVTGDMTWDFSKDGMADQATVGTEVIMANVAGVVNDANFKSDNIKVTANKQAGTKLQASMIMFHTTVDGLIKVVFSNTGDKSSERYLVVNGKKTDSGTKTKTNITYYGFVPAGDVVLTVIEGDGNMLNFASVQFTAKATPDYTRDAAHGDTWMAPGELGTVCIPNGAVATGGDLYTLEGKNSDGKIVFATVPNNKMTPGVPYLFQATSNAMNFFYTDEDVAGTPVNTGAMKGSFTGGTTLTGDQLNGVYYFNGHALWSAAALTELEVIANRAYVYMPDVQPINTPNPAPGRRYIIMDVHGQNATTGFGEVQGDEVQSTKVLINGQLYILRGVKMYDATGQLVK